ncbi:HAD family hydrolase [Micromonospora zhanjiangensis]|uniref:HAD family hydrolase n=1 Tax=Micromonospora zhanjiangensis TaxID=1522057 RepID=UPI0036700248
MSTFDCSNSSQSRSEASSAGGREVSTARVSPPPAVGTTVLPVPGQSPPRTLRRLVRRSGVVGEQLADAARCRGSRLIRSAAILLRGRGWRRIGCGMLTDTAPEAINGVIFDFHGTLVDGGDARRWIEAALRRLAEDGNAEPELSADQITGLREHLDQIWQHAHTIDPSSERDLSHERHRDVFSRTVALYPGIKPDLIAALYAVMPDQWTPFVDTLPVLRELRSRGIRIVLLSNIGLDIRPLLDRVGLSGLLDGVMLSFEVGLVKPDPAIFARALELLDVPGSQTLMVGDSPRDDVGGVSLGIRTLILPRTEGPVHGLKTVLHMVGNSPAVEDAVIVNV